MIQRVNEPSSIGWYEEMVKRANLENKVKSQDRGFSKVLEEEEKKLEEKGDCSDI